MGRLSRHALPPHHTVSARQRQEVTKTELGLALLQMLWEDTARLMVSAGMSAQSSQWCWPASCIH